MTQYRLDMDKIYAGDAAIEVMKINLMNLEIDDFMLLKLTPQSRKCFKKVN